jgi:hypothetical protein
MQWILGYGCETPVSLLTASTTTSIASASGARNRRSTSSDGGFSGRTLKVYRQHRLGPGAADVCTMGSVAHSCSAATMWPRLVRHYGRDRTLGSQRRRLRCEHTCAHSAELHARRSGPCTRESTYVGLDVHKETIAVAVAEGYGGEVRSLGLMPNRPEAIRNLVRRLGPAKHLTCAYEAGPCGYVLPRHLTRLGAPPLEQTPAAPEAHPARRSRSSSFFMHRSMTTRTPRARARAAAPS